jgi:tRNA dimethylallyltransferase
MKDKIVIIAGPTATGKSDFALRIAKKIDGEIISCDSMQIYKCFNIGTAKIKESEMQGIKHYMIDIVEPNASFSVYDFKDQANMYIKDILSRGKVPILVGGTGLYIQAILYDYDCRETKKDDKLRQYYENYLKDNGKIALFEILKQKNEELSKKINVNDTKRVIRALESCNDKSLSIQKEMVYNPIFVVLNTDRKVLYDRINKRVDKMIDSGLIDEVKDLISKGIDLSCQSMASIGYKEWFDYFNGKNSKEKTIENIKQFSRNYAKRQITWFKHRENAVFFDAINGLDDAEKYIITNLYKKEK